MSRILELICRDNFGAAPCGRPDIPEDTGINIHADAIEIVKSGHPEAKWSQEMMYMIFPNGACVHLEDSMIQRVFYIEEVPSTNDTAIRCFLQEATRYCDHVILNSLDPHQVVTRFSEWHRHTLPPEEQGLLQVAEEVTRSIQEYRRDIQDLLDLLGPDKPNQTEVGCDKI